MAKEYVRLDKAQTYGVVALATITNDDTANDLWVLVFLNDDDHLVYLQCENE